MCNDSDKGGVWHAMLLQAIDMDPTNATILANRSLCWIRLGQAEQALTDAREARRLDPKWSKACYREGAALHLLQVLPILFLGFIPFTTSLWNLGLVILQHQRTYVMWVCKWSVQIHTYTFLCAWFWSLVFTIFCLLQRFDEAADAFYTGVTLNPENKELVDAFK